LDPRTKDHLLHPGIFIAVLINPQLVYLLFLVFDAGGFRCLTNRIKIVLRSVFQITIPAFGHVYPSGGTHRGSSVSASGAMLLSHEKVS
jgi:hypothetical protein